MWFSVLVFVVCVLVGGGCTTVCGGNCVVCCLNFGFTSQSTSLLHLHFGLLNAVRFTDVNVVNGECPMEVVRL